LRKHAKSLRELLDFNIELKGDIKDIIASPQEWAEKFAEDAIMREIPRYQKAKKLGESFAREVKD
jgi:hypothetical protein